MLLGRFAYTVMCGQELVSISNAIQFKYDDGKTLLEWPVGESVDNAVWITVFLVVVVIINLFPVRVLYPVTPQHAIGPSKGEGADSQRQFYGELEYFFGCFKLTFICMLIVMMLILDTMKRGLSSHPPTGYDCALTISQRGRMPTTPNRSGLDVSFHASSLSLI
jgi:hypothetical protein